MIITDSQDIVSGDRSKDQTVYKLLKGEKNGK